MVEDHVRALASWVRDSSSVRILLTHGHGDHAGCAPALSREIGADVFGPTGSVEVDRPLEHGESVSTDDGDLVALHTPGHTVDHLSYHWQDRNALFAGDLLLGRGNTTWVAEYPGCVADYLASLAHLRGLDLDVIYPAHGPALTDPDGALDRFEGHRMARIRQVARAREQDPSVAAAALVSEVYGTTLRPDMISAATRSVAALLEFVETGNEA
jgi:glyoxylase-like metal-dependent hydrolase (beta-lactamase superfamily II)